MAKTFSNDQKLQDAEKILQNVYQAIGSIGNQTQYLDKIYEEQEKKFANEGLVPYLQEVIEYATQSLGVPVTITANYKPGKGVQVNADVQTSPRTIPTVPQMPPRQPRTPSSSNNYPPVKNGPLDLIVNAGSGLIIHEYNATETFIQAINYAIDTVGSDKVAEAVKQYDIRLDKELLIKKGTFTEPKASSHALKGGYYTNTHSNTPTKASQLQRISDILNLHWVVSTK